MSLLRLLALTLLALPIVACQGGEPGESGGSVPDSEAGLPEALAKAQETGRNVLVVYGSESCPWSRQMEKQTLSDPDVQDALRGLVYVRLEQGENGRAFEESWGKQPTPTVVALKADGEPLGKMVSGVVGKEDFLAYAAWAKRGEGPQPGITTGGG
jgi:thioredoxin-related protein